MGIRKLEDTITLDFTTHNPFSGAVQDTDSLPICEIFEDDNDTAILTPIVTKRTGKIGNYRISIEATVINGFEIGKSYNVIISATVHTISAKSRIDSFVLDSKRISDLNDADISNLALEDTVQDILTEVNKIQPDIIDDKDSYKADVSGLATETNLNTKASQDSVDDIKEDTESILTILSTLISDIWNYLTRTLTVGTKDAEIDSIKSTVESLDLELDGVAKETTSQEILVAIGGITGGGLTVEQDAILRRALGLAQENYKIISPVYDSNGNMTTATIKIYPSASDCDADTNVTATYNVISTYDSNHRMATYKVKKI
jgi:archaellum component FlaC